jgi:isopenicillin-N epimerase
MAFTRRSFLVTGSAALTAGALAPAWSAVPRQLPPAGADLSDWNSVRRQFDLSPDYIHLGLFFLTSHPRPVRDAIESHRQRLDRNPFTTVERSMFEDNVPAKVAAAVAQYIGANADDIALTQNTTTGLTLLYHGLKLKPGDEVLTTGTDHFVHNEAIRLSTERNGASWRKVSLFDSYDTINADEMVDRLAKAIRPNTRVVGVTWVHSASGLRLPIRRIADAIANVNRTREANDRVLLFVDGVHGIGVEDPSIVAMGMDAFAAGTHKWIFGPRGTGFVWAKPDVWAMMRPLYPSFTSLDCFAAWANEKPPAGPAKAAWFTPGGFQAFEHWWALPAAFQFHNAIGPARITERIHALNQQMNEGLRKLPNVVVYTPLDRNLNAGMVCFDVKGMKPEDVVSKLYARKIIASTTPYAKPFARLACAIVNTPAEVEKTIAEVRSIA